jgi:hypothetical protein
MGNVTRTKQLYDDQLANEGKQRILIADTSFSENGQLQIYYREDIVDSKLFLNSMDTIPWWKKTKKTKKSKLKDT